MWPNPQKTADLVTFTEEILNGKLHFLGSVNTVETKLSLTVIKKYSRENSIAKLVAMAITSTNFTMMESTFSGTTDRLNVISRLWSGKINQEIFREDSTKNYSLICKP